MSKVKTPQEKKALSYAKDRRNAYGENDKGRRQSIRKNKQLSSQTERSKEIKLRSIPSEGFGEDQIVEIENLVVDETKSSRLKGFKKYPDASLSDHLETQKRKREDRVGRKKGNS